MSKRQLEVIRWASAALCLICWVVIPWSQPVYARGGWGVLLFFGGFLLGLPAAMLTLHLHKMTAEMNPRTASIVGVVFVVFFATIIIFGLKGRTGPDRVIEISSIDGCYVSKDGRIAAKVSGGHFSVGDNNFKTTNIGVIKNDAFFYTKPKFIITPSTIEHAPQNSSISNDQVTVHLDRKPLFLELGNLTDAPSLLLIRQDCRSRWPLMSAFHPFLPLAVRRRTARGGSNSSRQAGLSSPILSERRH